MRKKRYLKKWVEALLIIINSLLFCIIACINDFTSIKTYLLITTPATAIIFININILLKYSKTFKD